MKRQTKKLILNIATGIAIAASAVVVLAPAIATAAPAMTTSNVNVRSGPGPSFSVVDTLRGGTPVDVGQCRGDYCQVNSRNTSGWVSSGFLSRGAGGGGGSTVIGPADPGLGINIGPGGISIGVGTPPPPGRPGVGPGPGPGRPDFGNGGPGRPDFNNGPGRPGPGRPGPRPPVVSQDYQACFYDRSRLRGDSFCMAEGESIRRLGNDWIDRISSIENPDGLEVRVCYDQNFRNCRTYTTNANTLGDYDDSIQSIQVR